jgi:predicted ATP-grasp superfamily ATP-dependent carboligase
MLTINYRKNLDRYIASPDISSYTIPKCAEPNWHSAVIAGASQTGVLGMRSLIRRGIKAVCFDCSGSLPGFKSVYGRGYLCPNPDDNSDKWLDFMIELARKIGDKPVLIPSSDQFVSAIAKHSESLKEWYIISPGIAIQGLLAEKQTQYGFLCHVLDSCTQWMKLSSSRERQHFPA